jgi:DNA-nicking Smr family endonuclease
MSRRKNDPSGSGRQLQQDEDELWSAVTRSIQPLRRPRPITEPRALAREVERTAPADTLVRARAASAPTHRPSKPALPLAPISRRTRQRLARGALAIDGRIDLHGLTQGEAHGALMRFLRNAQADRMKFVLVITGKGHARVDIGSDNGVLRREVPRWLKLREFRDYVLGYEPAHAGHGGEGALYVRLRRARGTRSPIG